MVTWKLEIEYEGTRYRGWQIQSNARTIQGELHKTASQIFPSKFEIFGAGRTDAGVHAVGQIAHLKVAENRQNLTPLQIQYRFNDLLPHDINIKKVRNAPENFHARKDAVARYYLYQISTRRTAFSKNFVWWVKDPLNLAKMQEAAALLVGRHDFQSFYEEEQGKNQSTSVVVKQAEIFAHGDLLCFRLGAGHFLRKMVRRLTGMIVETGRGRVSLQEFESFLHFKSNVPAQFTAPPSGLFLEKILYKGDVPPTEKRAIFPV